MVTGIVAAVLIGLWAAQAGAQTSSACDPEDILVATTPSPPSAAYHWRSHLRQVSEARSAAKVDVIILGDSIAERWPAPILRPLNTFNMGTAGDRTQHVLWRLRANDWSRLNPRYVVLLIGTNNMAVPTDKACSIQAGIAKIASEIQVVWPTTKILSPGIIARGPGFAFRNDERLAVNASLKEGKITILPVDDDLTCHLTQPCDNYLRDIIHLTPKGYAVLAAAVRSLIATDH